MANVFATKTGNWSDPTVWNTGALPTAADDVWANNFVVTVNVTTTVRTIRNRSTTGITAGGRFDLANGSDLSCTQDPGFYVGSGALMTFSRPLPESATIRGILPVDFSGMASGSTNINHSGTGTVNIVGNMRRVEIGVAGFASAITITGGGVLNYIGDVRHAHANDSNGILVTTTAGAVINITGNLLANSQFGANDSEQRKPVCINSVVACTVNVTGNCFNEAQVNGGCFYITSGSSVINITGNVTGGASTSQVPVYVDAGRLNIIGTITAGGAGIAVRAASLFVTGPLIQSVTAIHPISSANWRWHSTLTPTYYAVRNSTNTGYRNFFSSDNPDSGAGQAAATNVRLGVVYGPTNELVGTCAIPAANQVVSGIPVDNTVGTAVISPEGLAAALAAASAITLDLPASSLNTPGSIGERFKNVSTVESVGTQIAAFK
jgi:hypothetical protein